MKRAVLILVGGVVVVAIAVVVVVFFFLGDLIKTAVETTGSSVTKTQVTLTGADVDLTSGKGTLKGFNMANPSGFKSDSAFKFGEVSVIVDTSTLNQDPIVIKEILINAPQVTYEIGEGGSNIDKIRENVEAFQKSTSSGGGGSDSGGEEGPNLIIENLYLRNGKVTVMASQFMDNTLDADLPEVHLTDIGKEEGGASPGEVASQTLDAVLGQVTSLVGRIDLTSITDALGGSAAGAVKAISEGAGNASKVLTEGTEGASETVEGATEGAKDAVKSLFGGSD